jgi:H+/Cl- antiporter ClcA
VKIGATALTLEVGGSGGIVTPLFFIGSTTGVAFAHALHLPVGLFAAFGFIAVLAAAANTPIAAAVMGMELLPGPVGVYAALCAGAAFLMVGHRSVYASQRLGLANWPPGSTRYRAPGPRPTIPRARIRRRASATRWRPETGRPRAS